MSDYLGDNRSGRSRTLANADGLDLTCKPMSEHLKNDVEFVCKQEVRGSNPLGSTHVKVTSHDQEVAFVISYSSEIQKPLRLRALLPGLRVNEALKCLQHLPEVQGAARSFEVGAIAPDVEPVILGPLHYQAI